MITTASSLNKSKQEIRQVALVQLYHCKEQLQALETYNAKKIKISQDLWVPKKAIETYEQCQVLCQAIDQLACLVRHTLLLDSTALVQGKVDKPSRDSVSTILTPY